MVKRTMGQAIRAYCLQCSNHSKKEVELCPMAKCPLYPFRLKTERLDHPLPTKNHTSEISDNQPILFD